MGAVIYERAVRRTLFRLGGGDAEVAHERTLGALAALGRARPVIAGMRRLLGVNAPVEAFGLRFPSPVGLAAGLDKNGVALRAWPALGFGFVEVGTVTAEGQPGNPKPRLFRLPQDRALINRMGFNNDGADAAASRLAHRRGGTVGINIGKTKRVSEAEAEDDFARSAQALAPLADYLVVNVSSPNTPGLRDLQAVDKLRPLLARVRAACDLASPMRKVPLLVKIAPDLADADIDAIADLALELSLDGIIATNTTIARTNLTTPDPARYGAGGLSGAPLKARSLEVLRRLRARVGSKLLLIAVGGIETADDAWDRIRAGATLVQAYTGFIYGGPLWPKKLQRELAAKVRAAGLTSIEQAVGADSLARAAGSASVAG
jgi:dihydroorotate dehydrogenase